jgi:MFS family permease
MVALPFVPIVNERRGRKVAIYVGSVIMIIGAVLQGASQACEAIALVIISMLLFADTKYADAMFVMARIILGFGIPFAIVGASSLIGELAHPRERPILTSLFNVSWFVGAIVAAGINLGTFKMNSNWSWRIPSYLQ